MKGVDPEVSQTGQSEATHSTPAMASAPPRPTSRKTPAPLQAGSILEGLVELRETDPLFDKVLDTPLPVAAPPASRRNLALWSTAVETLNRLGPRVWWAAAGLLLLGFVVAWAWLSGSRPRTG